MLRGPTLLVAIACRSGPAIPGHWGRTRRPCGICASHARGRKGHDRARAGRDRATQAFLAVRSRRRRPRDGLGVVSHAAGGGAVLMIWCLQQPPRRRRATRWAVPSSCVTKYRPAAVQTSSPTELPLLWLLNLAMAGLLVARVGHKTGACCAGRGLRPFERRFAACLQIAGSMVPIAQFLVGARLARPDTTARVPLIAVSARRRGALAHRVPVSAASN